MNITQFLENISKEYKEIENIPLLAEKIERILNRDTSMEEEFEAIGTGSFKEAYELNDDYVIKFAAFFNNTEAEMDLNDKAIEECVSDIFLPTWFYEIDSAKRPLMFLIDFDEADYECDDTDGFEKDEDEEGWVRYYPKASHIIIQPKIHRTVGSKSYQHLPYNKIEYYQKAAITDNETGEVIEYEEVRKWQISSKDWIQSVLDLYGIEQFMNIGKFLDDYDVSDLHSENIGYIEKDGVEYPVIFDCFSEI